MTSCVNRRRIAAGAVTALAVLCVLVLCWIFFAEAVDHDCIGKDCPVCARLAELRTRIRSLTAVGRPMSAVSLVSVVCALLNAAASACCVLPVRDKVRLNI